MNERENEIISQSSEIIRATKTAVELFNKRTAEMLSSYSQEFPDGVTREHIHAALRNIVLEIRQIEHMEEFEPEYEVIFDADNSKMIVAPMNASACIFTLYAMGD